MVMGRNCFVMGRNDPESLNLLTVGFYTKPREPIKTRMAGEHMLMFTNSGCSILRFFVLSVTIKGMAESVYFSSPRLTRSKVLSSNKDLELSSEKFSDSSVASKLTSLRRKMPNIDKIEQDSTYDNLPQSTDISVKKEEVKSEDNNSDPQINQASVKKEKWEPPGWRTQLENINEMRKNRDAPVDSMGCDDISDALASPQVGLLLRF